MEFTATLITFDLAMASGKACACAPLAKRNVDRQSAIRLETARSGLSLFMEDAPLMRSCSKSGSGSGYRLTHYGSCVGVALQPLRQGSRIGEIVQIEYGDFKRVH